MVSRMIQLDLQNYIFKMKRVNNNTIVSISLQITFPDVREKYTFLAVKVFRSAVQTIKRSNPI